MPLRHYLHAAWVALALLCAPPAWSATPVTFVSGKGSDSGACATPATACRTFAYALTQSSAGGEIKALDPADYQPVNIDKAISITGVEGASVLRKSEGPAITISGGANDAVNISRLTIDGLGQTAWYGILQSSGGPLTVSKCVIRNYGAGISSSATRFLIEDTLVTNTNNAIQFVRSTGQAKGALRRVTVTNSIFGFWLVGPVQATIIDSVSLNNSASAVVGGETLTGSELLLAHSTLESIAILNGSAAKSPGNNFLIGNVSSLLGKVMLR